MQNLRVMQSFHMWNSIKSYASLSHAVNWYYAENSEYYNITLFVLGIFSYMFDIWYTAQNLSGYSAEHQSQAVIW